ncbi:hypothetical protein AGR2A_Cc110009 [Agrobacterium genomosp. 2 str. CFBP 5494]|uniref:Uncharacterized protein n=1 Tax=Agrobacterium genomosp. 2 str. CFBP 5494 TaxID=1183436 RepID=A0A9W5F2A3_9HYPH|nr:hypothetical protein AGR2A_Cc110009 [Agrobacterium genomosp. 2 str. CFBP 5494]
MIVKLRTLCSVILVLRRGDHGDEFGAGHVLRDLSEGIARRLFIRENLRREPETGRVVKSLQRHGKMLAILGTPHQRAAAILAEAALAPLRRGIDAEALFVFDGDISAFDSQKRAAGPAAAHGAMANAEFAGADDGLKADGAAKTLPMLCRGDLAHCLAFSSPGRT